MKTNLLKLAFCALAVLPMGAWAIDFGTEKVVSTTKTWTFDGLTSSTDYTSITSINDEYYLRASTSDPNRKFTVTAGSEETLVFSDGYVVKVQNYLQANGAMQNYNDTYLTKTQTAGNDALVSSRHSASCSFAFNASVPGTVYVYGTNADDNKKVRIVFTDGTNKKVTDKTNSGALALTEVTYTSTVAGSFFIGGPESTFRIYAVRFVPTSEKKDEWVYIGSTGYATWANLSGKDIESLPEGLTAYSATAGAAGSATVTLTSLAKMRRAQGYILKGTPNTNYSLTYGGTSLDDSYNGGDMLRATADMADFAATITGDDSKTRYRYILGNDNGTAKFFVPSGSGTLKKGKAYLQTLKNLTASSARGINIIFDDEETTAIKSIDAKAVNNGKYYNLLGVEVAQPAKGLYIVNGKKVLIK